MMLATIANKQEQGSAVAEILGTVNDDVLNGTADNDTINGLAGNDTLTGGAGIDTLTGGAGFDIFRDTAAGLNGDTITDFGPGETIIISDAVLQGFTFNRNIGVSQSTLTYTGGSVTLASFLNGPMDSISSRFVARAAQGGGVMLTVVSDIFGTFNNDVLVGTVGDDIINGRFGNDTLTGATGNDVFQFYAPGEAIGDDRITDFRQGEDKIDVSGRFFGFGSDLASIAPLISQVGNDTKITLGISDLVESIVIAGILPTQLTDADFIFNTSTTSRTLVYNGGSGVLIGGVGDDTLTVAQGQRSNRVILLAGAGNDRLNAGPSSDSLYGQGGNDTFVFSGLGRGVNYFQFGNDIIFDFVQGQERIDLSRLRIGSFNQLSVVLSDVGGNAVLTIGTGSLASTITINGIQAANLTAQDFIFDTSAVAETLSVTPGQTNILFAGLGDDTLNGNDNDINTLIGGQGTNTLVGGQSNDRLFGFEGNDRLFENGGNDLLSGGSGADTFIFGRGINGNFGVGALQNIFIGALGNDIITDFTPGEDKIDLSRRGVASFAQIAPFIVKSGADTLIFLNSESILLKNVTPNQISISDFIFDTSTAVHTTNSTGFISNIVYFDSLGADTIRASGALTTFMMTRGDDLIFGGAGFGTDLFVFTDPNFGRDVIRDTNAGRLRLDFSAFSNISFAEFQAALVQDGPDTIFTLPGSGGASTLTFFNILPGQFTAANLITPDQIVGRTVINNTNILFGSALNDRFTAGGGDNRVLGGRGIDTAEFSGTRGSATVTKNADGTITITSRDGTDTLSGTELFRFFDGLFSFTYADPGAPRIANFAVGAGGWSTQDRFPRQAADVNGDGFADIVGFGQAGTLVALGSANGTFAAPISATANFGVNQGWSSDNIFHRELADVNNDGRADIVGFGTFGVLVALAQADGTFGAASLRSSNFNPANGWSTQDGFARTLADVNGDGYADIIGFGTPGTFVALGSAGGQFGAATLAISNFGTNQGWSSNNSFHREVADVNGDGRADIVGFGTFGTLVALGQTNGTFGTANLVLGNFGTNQGWSTQDVFTRDLADVNGDGRDDIVGFGIAGTFIAFGQSNGTFSDAAFDVANFGRNQGWTSDTIFHRELADINGDGLADIVGFGFGGVFVSTAFDALVL